MVAYPSHYEHDYYEILGVSKTSTQDEIKREYRKLAMKYHPDKNPTNKAEAETMFKLIAEAYDVIGDPEKRRHFDLVGHGPQGRRPHEGTPVSYAAGHPFGPFDRPADLFGFDDFGFAPFSLHTFGVFDAFDMFFKDSQDLFRTASHDFFNDPFFSFGFPDPAFEPQFAPKTHRVVTTTAPNGTTRVRTETVIRHPDGSVETIVTGKTPDGPQATTSSSYHPPPRVSHPPPSSKPQRPPSRVTFGAGPATSGGRHGRRAGASRSVNQTANSNREFYANQPFSTGQSSFVGRSQGGHHNGYKAVRTHR